MAQANEVHVTAVAVLDATYDPAEAQIAGSLSLLLRATRSGFADHGRTHEATVTCSDASGNTATAEVTVSVPHDSAPADDALVASGCQANGRSIAGLGGVKNFAPESVM